jgi:hypothetical protein
MRAALRRDRAPREVDRHTARGLHVRGDTSRRFNSARARSRRCASRPRMSGSSRPLRSKLNMR